MFVQAQRRIGPMKLVANGDDCVKDSICADIHSCCGPAEFDGWQRMICNKADRKEYKDSDENIWSFMCLKPPMEKKNKSANRIVPTLTLAAAFFLLH